MIKKKEVQSKNNLFETHSIRVRFNETDPLGIVWHGYYLHYFEDGREAFGRKYGISYLDVEKHGYFTPIVKSTCEHKLPLRYGEIANVETNYINTASAKMVFSYKITNEKGEVVCIGETIQVFVDKQGELSLSIPLFFEAWKRENNLL